MTDLPPPASSCPICQRPTVVSMRPFCSRRCADADLGRWFSGHYRVPVEQTELGADDEDTAAPA